MNKRHLVMALGLFVALAALAGCGKTSKPASPLGANIGGNNGATAVDVAQVNDQIASNPALIDEGLFASTDAMNMTLGAGGTSIIRPVRWWRTADSISRVVDVVYGDPDSTGRPTTAVATITKRYIGQFNILAGDTGVAAIHDSLRIVRKPLDDTWLRKLAFRRFRVDSTTDSSGTSHVKVDWRIVGTSGVQVTSAGATTHIQSIRIQAGARDTTITDPLELHRLRRILWLPSDTPVTITVSTGRASDVVVLFHNVERRRFVSNGDGTFTIQFKDLDFPGLRHFGVNAFSAGTLMDDTEPYDSQAWLLPFAVRDHDCDVDRGHH